jgi:hypothetical protein
MASPDYVKDIPNPYFSTTSQRPPYFITEPSSVQADKKGLKEGKLLIDDSAKTEKLKRVKADLLRALAVQRVTDLEVCLTKFENWSSLEKRLLLYVKPKTSAQVEGLVKAAKNVKHTPGGAPLKVSYSNRFQREK